MHSLLHAHLLLLWLPTDFLLVQNLVDVLLVELIAIVVVTILVGRPLLAEDFEAIDRGNVSERAFFGVQVGVSLEKNVRERKAEVSSVDVQVLLAGHVNFLTPGTVSLKE